jgi:hypothetical protein
VEVQPRRVECTVEEIIRDDERPIPTEKLSFSYFASSIGRYNPYHKFLFQAEPGHRYVFALIREGTVLRSIGDVGDYSVPVYSGFHSQPSKSNLAGRRTSPAEEGLRISQILLQPGPDFAPIEFSRSVAKYLLISEAIGAHLETYRLLRELLRRPESSVRVSTCFELSRFFPGQYECLEEIQGDASVDAPHRRLADERLIKAKEMDQSLLKNLRDPALLGTSILMKPDSLDRNYEQLQILLNHPILEFRSLACTAIRRYYPRRPAARCEVH